MLVDSPPQPCPRCLRPTVLVSYPSRRQWIHVGTQRADCGGQRFALAEGTRAGAARAA